MFLKRNLIKTFLVVAIITFITGFAFMFTACDNPQNSGADTKQTEIEVTVETEFEGDLTDEDIASGLKAYKVNVNDDTDREEVTFTVKSYEINDEQTQIVIVVDVDGVEKSITASYTPAQLDPPGPEEPEREMREDVKSLYDIVVGEGNKSVTITLSAVKKSGEEISERTYIVNINVLESGSTEFSIITDNGNGENLLFAYKDLLFYADGKVYDLNNVMSLYETYTEEILPEDFDIADLVNYNGEDEENVNNVEDVIYKTFFTISDMLDYAGVLPFLNYMMPELAPVKVEKGVNTVTINSSVIKAIVPLLASSLGYEDIDFEKIFSILNFVTDGALNSDDIAVTLSFGLSEEKELLVGASYKNGENAYGFTAQVNISSELAEIIIPDVEPGLDAEDLKVSLSFELPESGAKAELCVVLHLSDLFDGVDNDIITAKVNIGNTEDAIRFVLNDKYVFLDVSGLINMNSQSEEYVALYKEISIDELPDIINEKIPQFIAEKIAELNNNEEDELTEDNGDIIDDQQEEPEELAVISQILKYFRFIEISDESLIQTIKTSYNNLKEIISANEELIKSTVVFDEAEGVYTMRIAINTVTAEGNGDLFKILNLFVGIPGEGEFEDIDVNALIDEGSKEIIGKIFGVNFDEMMENLYVEFRFSMEDGVVCGISLDDGENISFVSFSAGAEYIEREAQYSISVDEKTNALGVNDFYNRIVDFVKGLFVAA